MVLVNPSRDISVSISHVSLNVCVEHEHLYVNANEHNRTCCAAFMRRPTLRLVPPLSPTSPEESPLNKMIPSVKIGTALGSA